VEQKKACADGKAVYIGSKGKKEKKLYCRQHRADVVASPSLRRPPRARVPFYADSFFAMTARLGLCRRPLLCQRRSTASFSACSIRAMCRWPQQNIIGTLFVSRSDSMANNEHQVISYIKGGYKRHDLNFKVHQSSFYRISPNSGFKIVFFLFHSILLIPEELT
jgi:hypothetical protein